MRGKKRPRAWCEDCMNSKAIDARGNYWPHNPLGISMWEGIGWCPASSKQVIQHGTTYDPTRKEPVYVGTF